MMRNRFIFKNKYNLAKNDMGIISHNIKDFLNSELYSQEINSMREKSDVHSLMEFCKFINSPFLSTGLTSFYYKMRCSTPNTAETWNRLTGNNSLDPTCPICGNEDETPHHLLFECEAAKQLKKKLLLQLIQFKQKNFDKEEEWKLWFLPYTLLKDQYQRNNNEFIIS